MCGGLLVLWDQHAVHERIRVERLLADALVEGSSRLAVKSAACQQPLIVSLPREEAALILGGERQLLEQWGVKLAEVSQKGEIVKDDVPSSSLALSQIPQCFLSTDLARKVDLCRALLMEAASKEEESASPRLPRALYDHLASQACRGAVMFGQKIATEDCHRLDQAKLFFFCKAIQNLISTINVQVIGRPGVVRCAFPVCTWQTFMCYAPQIRLLSSIVCLLLKLY